MSTARILSTTYLVIVWLLVGYFVLTSKLSLSQGGTDVWNTKSQAPYTATESQTRGQFAVSYKNKSKNGLVRKNYYQEKKEQTLM
jgi:hypothetical protein